MSIKYIWLGSYIDSWFLKFRREGGMKGLRNLQKRRPIPSILIFLWESLGVEVKGTAGAMKLAVISVAQP